MLAQGNTSRSKMAAVGAGNNSVNSLMREVVNENVPEVDEAKEAEETIPTKLKGSEEPLIKEAVTNIEN